MTDNVVTQSGALASVPASTTYAFDQISSVYYARQKIAAGADGSWTGDVDGRDTGSGSVALYVDPRLNVTRITVAATVSTSPAYTAKDNIGGELAFANPVRASGGYGHLESVVISDRAQQMAAMDLVLFDRSISANSGAGKTDNAIFDPDDTDLSNCVGHVAIYGGHYADFSDNSVATVPCSLPIKANATTLYGYLVARATPTFATTADITVILTFISD